MIIHSKMRNVSLEQTAIRLAELPGLAFVDHAGDLRTTQVRTCIYVNMLLVVATYGVILTFPQAVTIGEDGSLVLGRRGVVTPDENISPSVKADQILMVNEKGAITGAPGLFSLSNGSVIVKSISGHRLTGDIRAEVSSHHLPIQSFSACVHAPVRFHYLSCRIYCSLCVLFVARV